MKIKNLFYNDYLKVLRNTQGHVEAREPDSQHMQELGYINDHIERHWNGTDFSYAIFYTQNGFKYKVTSDAKIYKIKDGKLKAIKPHIYTNLSTQYKALRYMDSTDKKQHNVLLHLVMMVCAYPEFYETYLSNKDFKVNHTIIVEGDNRGDYLESIYNLELTTHNLNIKHGWFIKRYGLYNVHVEAEDLSELEPILIKLDDEMSDELKQKVIKMNKKAVDDYYVKRGLILWVK